MIIGSKCPCGSGYEIDTSGKCYVCRNVYDLTNSYTQPKVSVADHPLSYATVRVEKLVNGYIVQVGYGRAEVFVTLDDVVTRLKMVLQ